MGIEPHGVPTDRLRRGIPTHAVLPVRRLEMAMYRAISLTQTAYTERVARAARIPFLPPRAPPGPPPLAENRCRPMLDRLAADDAGRSWHQRDPSRKDERSHCCFPELRKPPGRRASEPSRLARTRRRLVSE